MMLGKKSLSKLVIVFVIIVFLINLAGCAPSAPAKDTETITVTDQLGRQVTVKKNPQRIISGYYISTTFLIALGLKDNLVGIEMQADKRPFYQKIAPEMIQLPGVGTAKALNIEECLKLNPDLVILPYHLKDMIPQLEEKGIPVIAIEPESLELLLESFALMGQATGKEKRAAEIIEYYNTKIDFIKGITANLNDRPRVYLSGSADPLTTITREMYQNMMIELAGGTNVTQDIATGYWANISLEQLLSYNPQVILMVQKASYDASQFKNNKQLQGMEAVKNNKIYTFPSALEQWDYPMPASILGILWLTHTLHPASYDRQTLEKDIISFYQEFYQADLSLADFGL